MADTDRGGFQLGKGRRAAGQPQLSRFPVYPQRRTADDPGPRPVGRSRPFLVSGQRLYVARNTALEISSCTRLHKSVEQAQAVGTR